MFKNEIYKYFSLEIIKLFIIILFAFTAIAWTVRAVNFLDLIVEDGYPIRSYLLFSLLNVTNIITKFIPLSFLIALILSIFKFERQYELIILWTSGLKKIKLVNLFFLISVLVLLFQLIFAVFITPFALNKSRSIIKNSSIDSIATIIKTNDFSDAFKNTTFFVEKINKEGELENILIRDNSDLFQNLISASKKPANTTIISKKGYFEGKKLILFSGVIQSKNENGELNNINFKKTELQLNSLDTRTTKVPKIQETSTQDLFNCILDKNSAKERITSFKCPKNKIKKTMLETVSRRVGMPFYIPLISLIASFLLISNIKSKKNFFKKYLSFFIGFVVLVLAEILVRYSGFSLFNSFIYFAIPFVLMPLIYFTLTQKLKNEKLKL